MNTSNIAYDKAKIRQHLHENATILSMIYDSLRPFAEVSQLTKKDNPAYSRIAALFLKMCEQRFVALTEESNKLIALVDNEDFSIVVTGKKYLSLNRDTWHLVEILAVDETRNQYSMLYDFAESFITFAKYGYLPVIKHIMEEKPEIALYLLQEVINGKINKCWPKLAEVYPPQKMPFIIGNYTKIKQALKRDTDIFKKADELAILITSNNYALLEQVSTKEA